MPDHRSPPAGPATSSVPPTYSQSPSTPNGILAPQPNGFVHPLLDLSVLDGHYDLPPPPDSQTQVSQQMSPLAARPPTRSGQRAPSTPRQPGTPTRTNTSAPRRTPHSRRTPQTPQSRRRATPAASPLGLYHLGPAEYLQSTTPDPAHGSSVSPPQVYDMRYAVPAEAQNDIEAYEAMRASIEDYQDGSNMQLPQSTMEDQIHAAYQVQMTQSYSTHSHHGVHTQPQFNGSHLTPYGAIPQQQMLHTNGQAQQIHSQPAFVYGGRRIQPGNGYNVNTSRRQIDNRAQQYARHWINQYAQQVGVHREVDIPNEVVTNIKRRAQAQAAHDAHQLVRAQQTRQQQTQQNHIQVQHPPTLFHPVPRAHPLLMPSVLPSAESIVQDGQHVEPPTLQPAHEVQGEAASNTPEVQPEIHQNALNTEIEHREELNTATEDSTSVGLRGGGSTQAHEVERTSANSASSRREHDKHQLMSAIKNLNDVFAQRATHAARFPVVYSRCQHEVVDAMYNVAADASGLSALATWVWTADDVKLLQVIQFVSARLTVFLPTLRPGLIRHFTKIDDPEARWTATSKLLVMFYDCFSGLKAAILEREKKIGPGMESFTKLLDVDRKTVWELFTPVSDDELSAGRTAEESSKQKQVEAEAQERLDTEDTMTLEMLQGEMQRGAQAAELHRGTQEVGVERA